MGGAIPLMNDNETDEQTAVTTKIDDIIHIDKWKHAQPILEGIIGERVNRKTYGRNDRVVIYKANDGRIGTMVTKFKTVDDMTEYLQKGE